MQLVIHAPFGGRINRALGLALRKRFCRRFDFELQAAASDDAVVLSLGPQQSLPLADVPHFLTPRTAPETLAQALLALADVPGALALEPRPRAHGAAPARRPPQSAAHPAHGGRRPDGRGVPRAGRLPGERRRRARSRSPITRWCGRRCTTACTRRRTWTGSWPCSRRSRRAGCGPHFRDSPEPSPLSHEILNGRPYTYLDDAPLEERRTRAVALRRGLPDSARELGRLDPDAIARVRDEARPDPRDAEELHDALLELVVLRPEARMVGLVRRAVPGRTRRASP